jgi:predicted membrane-bound spermidine synthase
LNPWQQRYLYLTVFTSGLVTLGLELSASRLLGTAFGTSNVVWASIIGLILLYLTAGYFLGGYLADHSPYPATFYRVIAWGAFTAGFIPIAGRPLIHLAARAVQNSGAAVLLGSLGVMLILFIVPTTLLGTASPFSARLAIHDTASAGHVSGRLYAVSTIGSIAGTFLPVLLLLPTLGTTLTFLVLSGALLIVALIGMALNGRRQALRLIWMPLVLLAVGLLDRWLVF